jgi:hypothetical protein
MKLGGKMTLRENTHAYTQALSLSLSSLSLSLSLSFSHTHVNLLESLSELVHAQDAAGNTGI